MTEQGLQAKIATSVVMFLDALPKIPIQSLHAALDEQYLPLALASPEARPRTSPATKLLLLPHIAICCNSCPVIMVAFAAAREAWISSAKV